MRRSGDSAPKPGRETSPGRLRELAFAASFLVIFLIKLGSYGDAKSFSALPWIPQWTPLSGNGHLELAVVCLIAAVALYRSASPRILLGLALAMAFLALNFHTAQGAFTQLHPLSLLFLLGGKGRTEDDWARNARATVGLIFLFAALHKCNSSFLAGDGITHMGSTARAQALPALRYVAERSWLTGAIILIESLVGLLTLAGLSAGAWLAMLFSLGTIILMHKMVTVSLALLPFIFCGFPELQTSLRTSVRAWRTWQCGIAAGLVLAFGTGSWLLDSPSQLRTLAVPGYLADGAVVLLLLYLLRTGLSRTLLLGDQTRVRAITERKKPTAWMALLATYGSLPFFFSVPHPYSFTMFSGVRKNEAHFGVVLDRRFCGSERERLVQLRDVLTQAPKLIGPDECLLQLNSPRVSAELADYFGGRLAKP